MSSVNGLRLELEWEAELRRKGRRRLCRRQIETECWQRYLQKKSEAA